MTKGNYLFTSESVSEGHPDKVADQISDAVLDEFLARDPQSKVACETLVTTGQVIIAGEVSSEAYVDLQGLARDVIRNIGYNNSALKFDSESCGVLSALHEQSADINRGVVRAKAKEQGAGDQGMMFGYACSETDELMPMPITLAHKLTKTLADVRKSGELDFLRPDGKAMVSLVYENGAPVHIGTVVVSAQHTESVSDKALKDGITECVIKRAVPKKLLDKNTQIIINPTGRFVVGGPAGDTGVTGRKIIVDTYGGAVPHGGGAFSGKDASKVDRSASYYARYVCKNLVAAGLCDKVLLQVGYAIGKARPVSLFVDTFGTGDDERVLDAVKRVFDFRPAAIIDKLGLRKPIYRSTTNYGHFGREGLPWEKTDAADKLKAV